jgi:hypothetical protein
MKEYTVEVYDDGDTFWYLNGKRHRENGPAIEYPDGSKFWYINGNYHREDGPAVEWSNGDKSYYLNDERLSEIEFNQKMKPSKEMTVAEISEKLGYEVKIVK